MIASEEKYENPSQIKIDFNGLVLSNEKCPWKDIKGNIKRRAVVFEFLNETTTFDPNLSKSLSDESAAIISKGCDSFHDMRDNKPDGVAYIEYMNSITNNYFEKTYNDYVE